MKRNASLNQTQAKLARLERAKGLLDRRLAMPIYGLEDQFLVFSSQKPVTGPKGIAYLVNLREKSCTCPDYQKHQQEDNHWCKHLMAVWLLVHHPNDYRDWLPEWAKDGQLKAEEEEEDKLGKALAELSDEALARIIAYASAEQQERDYRRAVAEGDL